MSRRRARGHTAAGARDAVALAGTALLLSACATTVYHPYDEETRTGHFARRIGETTYYVEFLAERMRVGMDAARRYVARRCAELAVTHRKRFFSLAEGHGDYDTSLYRHEEPGHASCYGTGLGRIATAQCALSGGEVHYERRADRVRFRAICELADQAGSRKVQEARAHLGGGAAP